MHLNLIGLPALLCGALTASMVLAPDDAHAWEPSEPVQLIVGFAAGGGSDTTARQIVASAQECYPTPLVIVNKPGAAGTIAALEVSKAEPDGYTLLLGGGSESTSVPAFRDLPYDARSDFTPIIRLFVGTRFLVVNAKSDYQTIDDVIEAAEADPGQIAYGSNGVGGLAHALPLLLGREAGVEFKHVPYQGGAPAIRALLSGQIDFTVGGAPEIRGQVEGGNLRVLAIASEERNPNFPDVPTLKELGYGIVVENMKGWIGPAGLPEDVVKFHHDCFQKAMSSPTWQAYQQRLGERDGYLDGAAFGEAMTQLYEKISDSLEESR